MMADTQREISYNYRGFAVDATRSEHLLRLLAQAAMLCSYDRKAAYPVICEAQAWLWRLMPDKPIPSALELEGKLATPIEQWLPQSVCADYIGALLAGDIPSQLCSEMLLELDIRQQSEAIQAKVKEVRDRCRIRVNGDDLYRKFRLFLIQHPVISASQAAEILIPLNLQLTDFYEKIPAHLHEGGKIYCCPECGWPMNPLRQEVQCDSFWCREKQSVFYRLNSQLINRSTSQTLEGQPVFEQLRLRPPLWKFTLLPGLLELSLAQRIAELGLEVILWPDVDRADLRVNLPHGTFDIDAKVWASPHYLAKQLAESENGSTRWVVIPDYQKVHVAMLAERTPAHIRIFTQSDCIRELKQYAPAF